MATESSGNEPKPRKPEETGSPIAHLASDVRVTMRELRTLVAGSAIFGLLPSLTAYLGGTENLVTLPLAESAAIVTGSAGAVQGYLLFRPNEESREDVLALRGIGPIRAWIMIILGLALGSHLYLWSSVEHGQGVTPILAVGLASFTSMMFFGVVAGALNFLHEQRLVWTLVGRHKMHQMIREYRRVSAEQARKLDDSARKLEEWQRYFDLFLRSQDELLRNPNDTRAKGMRDEAAAWFQARDEESRATKATS